MDYSKIILETTEEIVEIDRGSLKIKEKFAFLLDVNNIILNNKIYDVDEEVEVVVNYTFTENSKRPKEKIKIYKINKIIKK